MLAKQQSTNPNHAQRNYPMIRSSLALALIALMAIWMLVAVDCAPSPGGRQDNGARSPSSSSSSSLNQRRPSFFGNLFRRQTNQQGSSSNEPSEADEAQTQTELDAQKFMDSLPNAGGSNNREPSTFRERVSDTFGLLREGVSNQFRSLRENWSDTVDDLRDTWGNSQE